MKKEDEKEEEKPDMRSKYAMINLIKNKLRAAGQRDPMVMAVDAVMNEVEKTIKKRLKYDKKIMMMNKRLNTKKEKVLKEDENKTKVHDKSFEIKRYQKNSPYNKETKKVKN